MCLARDVPMHARGDNPQLLELVVGACPPGETRAWITTFVLMGLSLYEEQWVLVTSAARA